MSSARCRNNSQDSERKRRVISANWTTNAIAVYSIVFRALYEMVGSIRYALLIS